MCREWEQSFSAFLNYIRPKPYPLYTIDRVNNDGNYEPGNVRWTDYGTQVSNRRLAVMLRIDRDHYGRLKKQADTQRVRIPEIIRQIIRLHLESSVQ